MIKRGGIFHPFLLNPLAFNLFVYYTTKVNQLNKRNKEVV